MLRNAFRYGIISGVIVAALMMSGFLLMQNQIVSSQFGEVLGYASMIIALSMIFLGIKKYRDLDLGGKISFFEALKVGLVITFIASFIYVLTWMFYSDTEGATAMMDEYFNSTIENIKNSGADQESIDAEIARMLEMKANYDKPLFKIFYTFMEIFPVGLLISIVSAWILKKKS